MQKRCFYFATISSFSGAGGFLPAMKQIGNVAALPGIVHVSGSLFLYLIQVLSGERQNREEFALLNGRGQNLHIFYSSRNTVGHY